MMYRRWLTVVLHRLAGRHPRVRQATLSCLGAGVIFAVVTGLMWHAHALGLIPPGVARTLSLCAGITFGVFLVAVRSGWSQRLADPVMTFPMAMCTVLNIVLAYLLVGAYRADVIILLAHTVAMAMLRLQPRQVLCLAAWATVWLTAAQVSLVWWQAPDFSRQRALAHFIVGATSLMALGLVGQWTSRLRQRIRDQAEQLRETLEHAQMLATTDMLTGLMNRRCMDLELEAERVLAQRTGHPFCIALIDLDHFKRVNDRFGHRAGDQVLQAFALLARSELRQVDRLARWGGEEFLVLMPRAELDPALRALERLRVAVSGQSLGPHAGLAVTLSAGVTQCQPGESLALCMERADQALYRAKHLGRNRCCVAPHGTAQTERDGNALAQAKATP